MSPTRIARFKRHYLGLRPWTRHSVVLLVAGLVYISYGFQLAGAPDTESRTLTLQVVLSIAPIEVWGGVFVSVGCLAIFSSRWPPVADTWGYMALSGLSAGWGSAYFFGMILGDAEATNWGGTLVWGLVSFLWIAISGLLNPDHTGVSTHG